MTAKTIDSNLRCILGVIVSLSSFVALTVFFLFVSSFAVGTYDEGLILTGAFRVLNGDVPSRDFYAVYGPAQFYILAGLFKVFGTNVLVARIYDSAIASTIIFIVYFFLIRFHPRWYSLCGAIFILAVLAQYQLELYPVNPVLVISLASASVLVNLLLRDSYALAYLPISLGIALILFFRYDISIIVLAAFGFPIIILKVIRLKVFNLGFAELSRETFRIFIVLTILPLVAIIILTKMEILLPALHDILKYNSANYVEMRSLPFPGFGMLKILPLEFISIYFPIFASILAAFTITFFLRNIGNLRDDDSTKRLIPIIVFTSLTCFFFVKGWVRTSGVHMLLANIPAVLLCFICVYQLGILRFSAKSPNPSPVSKMRIRIGVWILSLSFLVYMLTHNFQSHPLYRYYSFLENHAELPSLSIFWIAPSLVDAALYIKINTKADERILSATGRHDKIFVNQASLYFISQRMPATIWHHYEPGVQSSETVQREIISDLEQNEVSLIMRTSKWDNVQEPNKSAVSSNVFLLDQYLKNNFHQERSFGRTVIYLKN